MRTAKKIINEKRNSLYFSNPYYKKASFIYYYQLVLDYFRSNKLIFQLKAITVK